MRRSVLLPLVAIALLGGCTSKRICTPAGGPGGTPPPDWREAISDPDHVKIRATRTSFLSGLQQARAAGFGPQIAAGGQLFDPDYSQDGATLPPGDYACRTYTLGSKAIGRPAFVVEPVRHCTVTAAGALQRFAQTDGPQRPIGRIYPDTVARTIFLGTTILADEATALHYNRDQDRDVTGAIQRIGPKRWRMVMPNPAWEATTDVMELTPAG